MKLKRLVFTTAIAAVVIAILGVILSVAWLGYQLRDPYYGARSKETFVEIPHRATTTQVADLLVNSGIVRHRLPFLVYMRYKDLGRRIQAGEYRFAEPASPVDVAQRLVRGDVYFQSITIPEGLTADETIRLLAQNGLGDPSEFERLLLKTEWIRDVDPDAPNLEGYLFPETYRFGRKVDAETVIRTMVDQFRKRITRVTEELPARDGWTVRRIVILASMIEKEAKVEEEGPLVASVLINRLRLGMTLGCDATIIYAMKLAGIYEGRIRRADLAIQSPYNSYIHTGLPPGPIANPGEVSIRAALNPAESDYLYYVSRNDGTHHFSKDYTSHLNAVNKYQRNR